MFTNRPFKNVSTSDLLQRIRPQLPSASNEKKVIVKPTLVDIKNVQAELIIRYKLADLGNQEAQKSFESAGIPWEPGFKNSPPLWKVRLENWFNSKYLIDLHNAIDDDQFLSFAEQRKKLSLNFEQPFVRKLNYRTTDDLIRCIKSNNTWTQYEYAKVLNDFYAIRRNLNACGRYYFTPYKTRYQTIKALMILLLGDEQGNHQGDYTKCTPEVMKDIDDDSDLKKLLNKMGLLEKIKQAAKIEKNARKYISPNFSIF